MMVEEREYARLLGYPWGTLLEGDIRSRAEDAAAWYEHHCKPLVYCVESVTAITAGAEVDREVAKLWDAGRVDEAYFLDRYAAAVVEKLAADLGPHQKPGTGDLPFEEQWKLFDVIKPLNPEIEMLPSGMLNPKNSLLAFVPRTSLDDLPGASRHPSSSRRGVFPDSPPRKEGGREAPGRSGKHFLYKGALKGETLQTWFSAPVCSLPPRFPDPKPYACPPDRSRHHPRCARCCSRHCLRARTSRASDA